MLTLSELDTPALLLERGLNVGFGRAPLFQNFLRNGPGVFRIDINAAAA